VQYMIQYKRNGSVRAHYSNKGTLIYMANACTRLVLLHNGRYIQYRMNWRVSDSSNMYINIMNDRKGIHDFQKRTFFFDKLH